MSTNFTNFLLMYEYSIDIPKNDVVERFSLKCEFGKKLI